MRIKRMLTTVGLISVVIATMLGVTAAPASAETPQVRKLRTTCTGGGFMRFLANTQFATITYARFRTEATAATTTPGSPGSVAPAPSPPAQPPLFEKVAFQDQRVTQGTSWGHASG